MAQVMKRRSLVNSGRRRRRASASGGVRVVRRRRRNGPKKMSAKQIRFFGTKAQRAGLKRRRNAGVWSHRKTKKRVKKSGVLYSKKLGANAKRTFKRRRKSKNYGTRAGRSWSTYTRKKTPKYGGLGLRNSGRRRKRRSNVGQIFSIGLAGLAGNPGTRKRKAHKRRGTKRSVLNMARRRTRRAKNSGHRVYRRRRVYSRRRRANSGSYRRRRRVSNRHHSRRRRTSNPGFSGALGSTTGLLKNAFSVIGGAVATRYATQLALGANNSGVFGYIGNAVAALALGWAAGKFMKSPQVGAMVTLGGFTGLALRMLSDLTPIGQYVNLSLSGAGKAGDTGIGLITDTTFYVPTVFNSGSMTSAQVPNQITSLIAAGSVGSKAGVGNYRRRRAA